MDHRKPVEDVQNKLCKAWQYMTMKDTLIPDDDRENKAERCRVRSSYLPFMEKFACADSSVLSDMYAAEMRRYDDLSDTSTGGVKFKSTISINDLKNFTGYKRLCSPPVKAVQQPLQRSIDTSNCTENKITVESHAASRIPTRNDIKDPRPQPYNTGSIGMITADNVPSTSNSTLFGVVCSNRAGPSRAPSDSGSSFWTIGTRQEEPRGVDKRSADDWSVGLKSRPPPVFQGGQRSAVFSEVPNKRPRPADDDANDNPAPMPVPGFRTAREQLVIDNMKSGGCNRGLDTQASSFGYGTSKKSLGTRRGPNSKFVPPVVGRNDEQKGNGGVQCKRSQSENNSPSEEYQDERLKNIDPKMIELILSEILDHGAAITWDDIAGLEFAKKTIKEIVVFPMLRPDLFTGLRGPPKGLLLFGPPGTGKTLIGKCIANQSKSTFFSISASSLTSKWVGEGEKMVRALFAVARVHQPAVVFIDEIDSLLSQRSDSEHESSRRIKTEFLVQLDGATTGESDRILVIGATNRPQEIDEAARRRFVKRLYIPLPEAAARSEIIERLIRSQQHSLTVGDITAIVTHTQGYSGADMANLCKEAAMGPIRCLSIEEIETVQVDQVRPITVGDFETALQQVKPSVSQKELLGYIDWNKQFGTWNIA